MQVGLIAEDRDNAAWLAERLTRAGFRVRSIYGLQEALRGGVTDALVALILDLAGNSPTGADCIAVLRRARAAQPLLVLSARGDWREKVACLDAGADDYAIKPVRSEEIVARLHAIIRRGAGAHSNVLKLGDLALDLKARCAWIGPRCLDLTRNEFRLLSLFLLRSDQTLTGPEIRDHLYAPGALVSRNAVEVQIARLRRKVGDGRIKTIRGVGYRYLAQDGEIQASDCLLDRCRRVSAAGCEHEQECVRLCGQQTANG